MTEEEWQEIKSSIVPCGKECCDCHEHTLKLLNNLEPLRAKFAQLVGAYEPEPKDEKGFSE